MDYSLLPQTSVISQAFTKISAENSVYCGLDAAGSVYCWGTNTNKSLQAPDPATVLLRPYLMKTGAPYTSLSVGGNTVCGITTSNNLECWGNNANGQLADGTTTDRATAQIIDPTTSYSMVSASYTTCAITTAGVLKCWGGNFNGSVGDGTTTTRTSPVVIAGTYLKIGMRSSITCAITNTNALKCWGRNYKGAVGDGTVTLNKTSPVTIDSSVNYSEILPSVFGTCGITTGGVLKCWGNDTGLSGINKSVPNYINNLQI